MSTLPQRSVDREGGVERVASPREGHLPAEPDEARALVGERPLPRWKPMAKATRVTLFEREVRERLSDAAVEILLGAAEVLSEGQVAAPPVPSLPGGEAFFGSTMLTIDLAAAASVVREPCDAAAARKVAGLMAADARIARRARLVAEREAARIAGRPVRTAATEVRVRADGTCIFIDVEIESEPRRDSDARAQRMDARPRPVAAVPRARLDALREGTDPRPR
jgi:hypothetical protein